MLFFVPIELCRSSKLGLQRIGPVWSTHATHKSKKSDVIPITPKMPCCESNGSASKSYRKEPPARKTPVIESVGKMTGALPTVRGMSPCADNFAKTLSDVGDCFVVCK